MLVYNQILQIHADVDALRRSPQPRPVGRARAPASSGKPRESAMRTVQKLRHEKEALPPGHKSVQYHGKLKEHRSFERSKLFTRDLKLPCSGAAPLCTAIEVP